MGATLTYTFTPVERDLIRRQFGSGWGEPRRLSGGLWLHRWASGPPKGQPKLSQAVQSLLARGLVEMVDLERGLPSAQLTAAGLEALQAMADDARQLDSARWLMRERAAPGAGFQVRYSRPQGHRLQPPNHRRHHYGVVSRSMICWSRAISAACAAARAVAHGCISL